MIDKQSMLSVLDSPASGDPDWNMHFIVDVPMPGAPDYSVVQGTHVERAYVVVADRHYDHIGTTLESGEEVDLGPDTMKVAISDVLTSFYQSLLCDLQMKEMMPCGKSGIWSNYRMMTQYRDGQEASADVISRREAMGPVVVSKGTGFGTFRAHNAPPPQNLMAVTPDEISRVPIQITNKEKLALISTEVEDTKEQGANHLLLT
jgi:hypothetical protein